MYQRLSLIVAAALASAVVLAAAQAPAPPRTDAQRRVDERLRALQRESDQLAGEAQTLIAELRKLEVERDLRTEQARQAEAAAADAQQALDRAAERLAALEAERQTQLPDLQRQLVDLYKHGRSSYARLLIGADGLRDFARATRAVAALVTINERRIAQHQQTLAALTAEREALARTAEELRNRQAEAARARTAAERAVAARTRLLARIDARRDLTAQYAGELQVAYARLQQLAASGAPSAAVAVPIEPFRGQLDWPVQGRLNSRFGQTAGRLGGTAIRNGIEIAAAGDAPVRAVHGGTVSHAGPFIGFGNLVILEHGSNNYSLYGYLGSIAVERGEVIDTGGELGRVGPSPAGPDALYFEMRIDGRSVDPLQWLEQR